MKKRNPRNRERQTERQTRKDRKTAALTAVFPVFAAFVSVFFFAVAYAVHDCAGEECLVCAQIRGGSETWQRFWGGMAGVFPIVSAGVVMMSFHLPGKPQPLERSTPVSVKIRLND
jgi:hypothetical protein